MLFYTQLLSALVPCRLRACSFRPAHALPDPETYAQIGEAELYHDLREIVIPNRPDADPGRTRKIAQ